MSDLHHKADGNPNLSVSSKSLNTSNNENLSRLSNLSKDNIKQSNENINKIPKPKTHRKSKNTELSKWHSTEIRKLIRSTLKRDIRSQSQIKKAKQSNDNIDIYEQILKDYSALPTDENGEVVVNSPQALLFRTNYSLNPTPSVNFNFDSIQSVYYNGQNESIHKTILNSNHSGTKYLGKMTLYYSTSTEDAEEIIKSNKFTQKVFGMYGSAIYFADNKQTAIYRAAIIDTKLANSLIVANVDMGTALVVEGPKTKLNLEQVNQFNCDSVLRRNDQNSDWEYAVYEPSRIQLVACYIFR